MDRLIEKDNIEKIIKNNLHYKELKIFEYKGYYGIVREFKGNWNGY